MTSSSWKLGQTRSPNESTCQPPSNMCDRWCQKLQDASYVNLQHSCSLLFVSLQPVWFHEMEDASLLPEQSVNLRLETSERVKCSSPNWMLDHLVQSCLAWSLHPLFSAPGESKARNHVDFSCTWENCLPLSKLTDCAHGGAMAASSSWMGGVFRMCMWTTATSLIQNERPQSKM